MRKVVKSLPKTKTIELNKITNESFVGIQWSDGKKIWITQTNNEQFKGICIGDQYLAGHWARSTKREYVENAMEQTGIEVYVFENKDELLTFLLGE
jgi:GMP synthase-like glutamine amidotransferase